MAGDFRTEIFHPTTAPAADWSAAGNWSDAQVPCAGITAEIAGVVASIDPGVTIETSLRLDGSTFVAGLVGNDGAVELGLGADLSVAGQAELFAYDSATNAGRIDLAGGATMNVVIDLGALTGLTGAEPPSFANSGQIDVSQAGLLAIAGTNFRNTGEVRLDGGTLAVEGGAIDGGGTVDLEGGAVATFGDNLADQTVRFGTGGGTLALLDPLLGQGLTLANFTAVDKILLPTLHDATLTLDGTIASLHDHQGHVDGRFILDGGAGLTITEGAGGETITGSGTIASPICDRGEGGDPVTPPDPPCFARGTMILTPEGYRSVETLAVGDRIVTASGAVKPLVWVGSRTMDLAVHPAPAKVQPIRFEPAALAPGQPRRRLRLSPDHAIWIDGVLIPARFLVNGATIRQEQDTLAVTYYHLEVPGHDVLVAEGAPCETYLDTGNRAGFAQASSWPVRHRTWDRDACAPLCTGGPRLRIVRERLHQRALAQGFTAETRGAVELHLGELVLPLEPGRTVALPARRPSRAVIHSERFVPACFDPASDDRRILGIALSGLRTEYGTLDAKQTVRGGFHPRAPGDVAMWTDGAGEIDIPQGISRFGVDLAGLPRIWRRSHAMFSTPEIGN